MLTRIPRPPPTGGGPPRRVYPIYNHFEDCDGRATLSIWFDESRPSLLPLFSLQVYVTYEASPAQNVGRELLAKELFETIMGFEDSSFNRLDIHFLRPGENTANCVEAFRAQKRATDTTVDETTFPICTYQPYWSKNSFAYIVFDQDWKKVGLKGLCFDTDASPSRDSADSVHESILEGFEIEENASELFRSWELRDEYMELFSDGRDSAMTVWQEIFDAANRLGLAQW
ncbi:hypothetical protein IWZ03DRAFT_427385 [Phyllosticta citriasiana]|uniref:Uncharacterized protein n=1 Tax=Phyllosticta citriasiana TaxID=595635 RepID=A0ABR1K8S5_9PEZI